MIDIYCERLGPELWSEPVNALTNLSFLVAAFATWRLVNRLDQQGQGSLKKAPQIWLLILLMVAIGLGSGLFHTFATNWARFLDVLPILLFQLVFIWIYGRKMIGLSTLNLAAVIGLYLFAAMYARQFPELVNGSLMYAPALVMLLILGIYHYFHAQKEHRILLWATLVFLVAVTFRSIDMLVCPAFALGTHFLWHLFNGVLVYLVARSWLVSAVVDAPAPGQAE